MKLCYILRGKPKLTTNLHPTYYEIPNRYRESFYLANASFFDSVNWFIHKGYEIIFPQLVETLMKISEFDQFQASKRISNIIHILDQCNNLIDIRYPIKRKDSSFDLIRTFNMNHGAFVGYSLTLGGIRISPDVTRDEMKGLSVLSTHRLSAMDIKARGSFGGIKINPATYSTDELEEIVRTYKLNHLEAGKEETLIEPDLNNGKREISWLYEEHGESCNRCDNDWVEVASSQGAFFGLNYFLSNDQILSKLSFEKGIHGKTFILQGLGKMGSKLAIYLQSHGAKCVGVKENDSHVYKKGGIDIHEAISYKKQYGTLIGFKLAKPVDDFEIYKEECDILILAAKQRSIVCHMAKSIKAKLIVEAAYSAITPSAYMILMAQSKIIVPDIFTCGGSAVAAYLRYLQMRSNRNERTIAPFYRNIMNDLTGTNPQVVSEDSVTMIEKTGMEQHIFTHAMQNIFNKKAKELLDTCEKYNIGYNFKIAAFIISIENIFNEIFCNKGY